jgi:tRNA-uridine 2-sulfurtransferase
MRIVVAMSGGVDSSVAAALLQAQGHEVIGVTLRLRDCQDPGAGRSCCGADGVGRARAVAGQLGVPHYVLDCARAFEEQVLRPAWDEYARGRTPSPCLLCNERIKLGALRSWAHQLGAPLLATGHYARVEAGALLRGVDPDKDQSYFLAGLGDAQLAGLVLPLGALTKTEVRARARALGLASAETHDSQDACLVAPGQSFAEMLRRRFDAPARPGPIVDDAGRARGRHDGVHRFTIGQRRGLGVSGSRPCWVRAIRGDEVVVTDDEAALDGDRLLAAGVGWIGAAPTAPFPCQVQVRSRHVAEAATAEPRPDGTVAVVFTRPVRAITPGQAAVLYDGARVLGRGWIHG